MMVRAFFVGGLVSVLGLVGCSVDMGEGEGEDTSESSEEALAINPCSLVRCAAGTHCEVKRRRAVCVPDAQKCRTNADCRLYDNYCDGCACQALSTSSPDPVCGGTIVACFVQPCMNKTAVCKAGTCAVQ